MGRFCRKWNLRGYECISFADTTCLHAHYDDDVHVWRARFHASFAREVFAMAVALPSPSSNVVGDGVSIELCEMDSVLSLTKGETLSSISPTRIPLEWSHAVRVTKENALGNAEEGDDIAYHSIMNGSRIALWCYLIRDRKMSLAEGLSMDGAP